MSYPCLDCSVPVSGERNTLRWKGKYINGFNSMAASHVSIIILAWIVVYLCLVKEYTPLERLVYRWCSMAASPMSYPCLDCGVPVSGE